MFAIRFSSSKYKKPVRKGFHHIGRMFNNFDFTRGCFNHVGIVAKHSFENFALSAQNNLVTRKDLILTQDFDVAKFILQENLHSMTLFHKFSKYESSSYKSLKRSVLFPFCNVWCWAWSPQIWVLKYQRYFLSHCNQKGYFFQPMIR